jgi:hypothetical protein
VANFGAASLQLGLTTRSHPTSRDAGHTADSREDTTRLSPTSRPPLALPVCPLFPFQGCYSHLLRKSGSRRLPPSKRASRLLFSSPCRLVHSPVSGLTLQDLSTAHCPVSAVSLIPLPDPLSPGRCHSIQLLIPSSSHRGGCATRRHCSLPSIQPPRFSSVILSLEFRARRRTSTVCTLRLQDAPRIKQQSPSNHTHGKPPRTFFCPSGSLPLAQSIQVGLSFYPSAVGSWQPETQHMGLPTTVHPIPPLSYHNRPPTDPSLAPIVHQTFDSDQIVLHGPIDASGPVLDPYCQSL